MALISGDHELAIFSSSNLFSIECYIYDLPKCFTFSTADVLESFATHPPLLLPTTDFIMDLENIPHEDEFSGILTEIQKLYGEKSGMFFRSLDLAYHEERGG